LKTDALVQELSDSFGSWFLPDCRNPAGGAAKMTQNLYPYDSIFSPIRVNRLTIKNRVVMAPMGNLEMCEENGRPNGKMLEYFFARAEGGVGLLTTGLIPVSHGVDPTVTEPRGLTCMPRIDGSRSNLVGWRDLAAGVHARGSRIFIQLTPGLGRVGPPMCLLTEKKLPVSASVNPNFYLPDVPCRPLLDCELDKIIKMAAQAAVDAKTMGLDGVYLHGHEGYLLDQLTSPAFNRRKCGKYTQWQTFGRKLIQAIRKKVGPDYPIMYRIDLSLALNETYGPRMNTVKSLKNFQNGRSIADTLDYMANLVGDGVDLFDVDLGCYDNWWLPHPPAGMPAGCFLDVSKMAKDYFAARSIRSNAGLPVPIVAVGKLGYPDLAEQALRDGKCDMIMLGRPVLADADWCNKAYAGRVKEIRPCIGCQEGCVNEFVEGGHPQCAVNPLTGFEDVLPKVPPKTGAPKRIAVVGAGPGGITFATTAAARGHRVDLFEAEDHIGGKAVPGSVPIVKFDYRNYLEWLQNEVERAQAGGNLTLHLNTRVDNAWLKEQGYDTVVYANGAMRGGKPPIPGIEKVRTVEATDLLVHPEELQGARRVVVVGGGVVGCETAYWLAYEQNCDVKVVEMLNHFMEGACTANRGHLIHYLEKKGVALINCAKVSSFAENKVRIQRNISAGVPDPYCTWTPVLPKNIANPLAKKLGPDTWTEELDADLVVLAMGRRGDDSQYYDAQKNRVAPELHLIGDAYQGGNCLTANRAAYRLALQV